MNRNVAAYILLAEQCVKDARSLCRDGSYRSAANRAYYGYFDAVRALLASKNISTKSHSAVRMLFGEHFVKQGLFSKADATAFHRLFLLRQHSDYEVDEDILESDALEAIETTAEFILQTEAYLRSIGDNE